MEIQFELMPLHRNLFVEPNPIPLKWAMARLGLCGGALRLPLTELAEAPSVVEGALRATACSRAEPGARSSPNTPISFLPAATRLSNLLPEPCSEMAGTAAHRLIEPFQQGRRR
jgi:hypothetical protein